MEPRVIFVCDNLLILSRTVSNLNHLGYAVSNLRDPSELVAAAKEKPPLFVLLDLTVKRSDACAAITQLKAEETLRHVPVLAFGDHTDTDLLERARKAGAESVTSNAAVAHHLPQLVEQLLTV